MKKYILSFLAIALAVSLQAAPITGRQAANNVRAFLYGSSHMKYSASPITMAGSMQDIQPYYIFNIGDNEGFVIASGDDAAYAILGYSMKGHLDYDSAPDNMKAWLDGYASDLESIQKLNLPARQENQTRAASWPAIPMLVTSKWNQKEPYNDKCPDYNDGYGKRPTGCVATAMAQVMYFHKWPQESTTSVEEYSFVDDPAWGGSGKTREEKALPPIEFDWDSMTDEYDFYSSEKSKNAVAELMQYCGHSVRMMYGVFASGAFSESISEALVNRFGYKETAHIVYRENFTSQLEWEKLMYDELCENRPILYSGVTKKNEGHQFVCDGYENEFFHINWGWGGVSDGFFKLSVLDPYDQGTGGAETGSSFSEAQSAVIGIMKSVEEDNLFASNVVASVGEEINMDITLKNYRKNYTSLQFELSLPEGITIPNDENGSPKVKFVARRSDSADHEVSVNKVSNGNYRFVICSPTNSCIKYKNGALLNLSLKVSPEMAEGYYTAYIKDLVTCTTNLESINLLGSEFNIRINAANTMMGDANKDGVVSEADFKAVLDHIMNTYSGPFDTKLADMDADCTIDIEDAFMILDAVLSNSGKDRNIVETATDYNDKLSFKNTDKGLSLWLKNQTSYKALQMDILVPSDIEISDVLLNSERAAGFNVSFVKIEKDRYRLIIYSDDSRNLTLNDGVLAELLTNELVVEAHINNIVAVTSDLHKMLLKGVGFKVPTGIDNVILGDEDIEIYTLDGVRVNRNYGQLEKGIYIINGKKVVIK